MANGNLRVIFHGLFAFVVHGECLEVLLPRVTRPDGSLLHAYRAGTSPAEQGGHVDLRAGESYQLDGVCGPKSITRFPCNHFPVVEGYRVIDRTPSRLYGSIYLPFPYSIAGFRRLQTRGTKYFSGDAAAQIAASSIPLVYVLTYTFDNAAEVKLDEAGITFGSNDQTLHFFAEPFTNVNLPPDHAKNAFRPLVRLFPGLDLNLLSFTSALLESCTNNVELDQAAARSLIETNQELLAPAPKPIQPICISLVVDNA